jgi:hypothetical protein
MVEVQASGVAEPVRGYPMLPGTPQVGDEVVIERALDGWNMVTHILGRDSAVSPNVSTVRSTGNDDGALLQEAINDGGDGSTVLAVDEEYITSRELVISGNNVSIVGRGFGRKALDGLWFPGTTVIRRVSSSGGATIKIAPVADPPYSERPMWGGSLENLHIRGGSLADYGINITAVQGFTVRDCTVIGGTVAQMRLGSKGAGGGAQDWPTLISVHRTDLTALGSSHGILFEYAPHTCDFHNLYVVHQDGNGIHTAGSSPHDGDDITFYSCQFQTSGGTGYDFDLNGVYNWHFISGYPMYGLGTTPVGGKGIIRSAAVGVTFDAWSTIDRRALVTVEPGAIVNWTDDWGRTTTRPDLRQSVLVHEEFAGGVATSGQYGQNGWVSLSGGTITYNFSEANHVGMYRMASAAAGVLCGMYLNCHMVSGENFISEFVLRPNHADSDTQVRFGWSDVSGDPPTNGIYFEKLYADTNWYAVCRTGGTQTKQSLGYAVTAALWERATIRRKGASAIGFNIDDEIGNGVDDYTMTTNIPTGQLVPFFSVKPQVSTNKTLDADAFQLSVVGVSRP